VVLIRRNRTWAVVFFSCDVCFLVSICLIVLHECCISVLPTINVQEHQGNDKSCLWHAADFADGELKDELFCIRFPSVESMCFFASVTL